MKTTARAQLTTCTAATAAPPESEAESRATTPSRDRLETRDARLRELQSRCQLLASMRRVTLEEYEEELRLEGSGGPASSKRQKKAKAKAKTSSWSSGLPDSAGPAEQEREEEDPFSTTTRTRTRTRLENTLYEAGLPADVGVPVVDSPAPSSIDFDYHAGAGHRSRSAGGTASTSAAHHRARLLESEHKRCSVLVREGETRKKLLCSS